MVDVGGKAVTRRQAVAEGCVKMSADAFARVKSNSLAKGDVLAVARIAGVRVTATVGVEGKTGVEMEALTAVTVACLTVHDMVKAADRAMTIEAVRLVHKSGGRSGDYSARSPSE
jgi:cyclic pyranopterin phosphate synthase